MLNPYMTATSDPRTIGYPSSCHAWVVNPENYHERVPIGCVGELLVEGYIAARGYLNDEQKTSQAFINGTAWAAGRDFRGYLTGDLVIQNPDGSFNIVGRKDSQVVRTCFANPFHFLTFTARNTTVSVSNWQRLSIISIWIHRSSIT